jgi:predicted amidohydrolase
MRVGYYQFAPEFGAPGRNLEKVADALSGVAADIVVLPELAFTGYYFEDRAELQGLAENVADSRTLAGLTRLCRERKLHLVTGFAERCRDRLFNSALVVGPAGLVYRYRKLHLFNTEKEYFDAGDMPLAGVVIGGATVGVMVCFDWVFPEAARALALQGVELICHPSNLVLSYCQDAMRTRSLENGVFSVTANRVGAEARPRGTLTFTGQSQIVDPRGERLACSGASEEALVVCEVDLSAARDKSMTARNDLFADRRPEFYGAIASAPKRG